jgi:hypothetical protein
MRALLRGDVAGFYLATSRGSKRSARLLIGLLRRIEKHGRYRTRISYCPPLNLLWCFLPDDGSTASRLHRCYGRAVWRERGAWGRAVLLASFLAWPVITLGLSAWATALNGPGIRRRTGKGVVRQILEQLRLAASDAVPPPWYYIFDLHDDAKRRRAGEYLHRYETKGGLFRMLKNPADGQRLSPLQNKAKFAARCRARGVETVPVAMELLDGEIVSAADAAAVLPAADLFVKPADGMGGRGAERWDYQGDAGYADGEGRLLSAAELMRHLRDLSRGRRHIVQPRIVNHPAIRDLGNGVLATARIMTCRNERGEFEVTDAVLRMAIGGNRLVDNFHAGGIAARIDVETGTLGPATDLGVRPELGWRDTHPDSGAPIRGRRLPLWPETLAFVQRAHAAFADRAVVGWDVAITESGPLLVEGNGSPDVDLIQRPSGEPLGNARLGRLLAFNLIQLAGYARVALDSMPGL